MDTSGNPNLALATACEALLGDRARFESIRRWTRYCSAEASKRSSFLEWDALPAKGYFHSPLRGDNRSDHMVDLLVPSMMPMLSWLCVIAVID